VLLLLICVVIVDGKKPMGYLDVSRIPSQTVNHRNRGVGLVEISVVESAQVTEVSVPTSPEPNRRKRGPVKVQGAQQHLHTEQHLHTAVVVRACHTTDGSTVPVSTVFDRFRELKMPRLQSNYVTHTGAERVVSCQLPLPTVNHAYLCLDLINCTIRPEIVTFSNNNKEKRRTSHLNAGHSRSHARFTSEPAVKEAV
ncbi:hypothetical protein Tco_1073738, partial [Tanacetum coccineum]